MGYWGGVICGCCVASILFTVMMFTVIEQNQTLRIEVAQLKEDVADHERIMRAYEFYNWKMSFTNEDKGK